jgi:hypothetical protein
MARTPPRRRIARARCDRARLGPPGLDRTEDALIAFEALLHDEPDLDACVVLLACRNGNRLAVVIDAQPGEPEDYSALALLLTEVCAQNDLLSIAIGRIAPVPVMDLVSSATQRHGWAHVIAAIDATGTPLVDVVALGVDAGWSLRQAAEYGRSDG